MGRRGAALLALIGMLLLARQSTGAAGGAPYLVWVDLQAMSLTVYQEQRQIGRWPIAGGRGDTPTPVGVYTVNRRFTTEGTGFGTRFLGLNVPWGQYGIHGTNAPASIGSRASHGCIRMFNRDIEQLYRLIPNGTRVVIEDGPYGEVAAGLKSLAFGDRGSLVVAAQRKLKALGYYSGALDGVYGAGMDRALTALREDRSLPAGPGVDAEIWRALGVMQFE